MTTIEDIASGVRRFRDVIFPKRRRLFEAMAHHQDPKILFIGCIDSRVNPAMLCHADPGDMFVERTPGNLVPIYGNTTSGVSASIEYAVAALQVTDIIVCGHSDCGALKAVSNPEARAALPAVSRWLKYADESLPRLTPGPKRESPKARLRRFCQANVATQLEHLATHPSVRRRLKQGDLALHGWVYDIPTGTVQRFNPATGKFALWPEKTRA